MKIYNFTAYIRILFIAMFFFSSAFVITGCSTFSNITKGTKKLVRDLKSPDDVKKKIAVFLFANNTFFINQNLEELFNKSLGESINRAYPEILLIMPGDTGCPDFLNRPLSKQTGSFDNLALARAGQRLGINAIITGEFIDIKAYKEKHGFFWFKDDQSFLEIFAGYEVYDTETGAKFLDEDFSYKTEIDEPTFKSIKAKNVKDIAAVKNALRHIAEEIGEKICDTVSVLPWKGYVASITGDKIVISAGKKAGLFSGDILEVYDSGKIIQGKDGQKFLLPGLKTGEIKLTNIYPDKAEAVLIKGDKIKPGDSLRIK